MLGEVSNTWEDGGAEVMGGVKDEQDGLLKILAV